MIVEKAWKDLTTAEVKALWNLTKKPSEFAKMLTAKLKEKNNASVHSELEPREGRNDNQSV